MQQMQQFAGPSSSLSPASNGSMVNQTGPSSGPGSSNSASFNFSGQQPPRRPQMSQQGISGMGGMGGSMRPPGKSGLTFDHILNRLQGELQKSRETGAELHTLTGAMSDIHETLGGGNLVCWCHVSRLSCLLPFSPPLPLHFLTRCLQSDLLNRLPHLLVNLMSHPSLPHKTNKIRCRTSH